MVFETLIVGFLLALLWIELTDVSPGGIIVPGYIALYLTRPLAVLVTFAAALTALALYRIFSLRLVIFGRRRFVLLILAGAVASEILNLIFRGSGQYSPEIRVIGWIIPGIIAASLSGQKALPVLASCLTVSAVTFAVVKIMAALI